MNPPGSGYASNYGWGPTERTLITYFNNVCYAVAAGNTKYAIDDRYTISFDPNTGTFDSFPVYGYTFSLKSYVYWFYIVWK